MCNCPERTQSKHFSSPRRIASKPAYLYMEGAMSCPRLRIRKESAARTQHPEGTRYVQLPPHSKYANPGWLVLADEKALFGPVFTGKIQLGTISQTDEATYFIDFVGDGLDSETHV